jgi:hypothetical protein
MFKLRTSELEWRKRKRWQFSALKGGSLIGGMSDLCSHVVGMGKEMYAQMLKKPEKILALAKEHKYVESFKYIFEHASQCYEEKEYTVLIKEYLAPPLITEIQGFKRIQIVLLPNDKFGVLFYYEKSGDFLLITVDGKKSFRNKKKLLKGVT